MKPKHLCIPLILLAFTSVLTLTESSTVPVHAEFRDPAQDTVAQIVGTVPYHMHVCDSDKEIYTNFFINTRYKQSFRSRAISQLFFGSSLVEVPSCGKNCSNDYAMIIAGSDIKSDDNALMAQNFYLPPDFKSEVRFDPSVKIFVADLHFFAGLNCILDGLYFQIYGPIVYCSQNLGFCERVINPGTKGYEAGYFDRVSIPRSSLLENFTAYMNAYIPGNFPNNEIILPAQAGVPVNTGRAGDAIDIPSLTIPATKALTVEPLEYARIDPCGLSACHFADLRVEIGYNWLCDEKYHIGFSGLIVIPTSPVPSPDFLFEPQCGNDHHWELGGTFQGHYTLWHAIDECCSFDVTVDLEVVHQFKNSVYRTFDLVDKGLSRYMLAEKFHAEEQTVPLASADIPAGSPAGTFAGSYSGAQADIAVETNLVKGLPQYFFAREFAPVANFSTLKVDTGSRYIIDGTIMFTYQTHEFTFDVGYNFWVRSCEEISFKHQLCNDFPEETWVLKGNGNVYGFTENTTTNYIVTQPNQASLAAAFTAGDVTFLAAPGGYPIGLPDNEGHATINYGIKTGDAAVPEVTDGSYQIASPDNRTVLFATLHAKQSTDAIDQATGPEIETTIRPQFITMDDLDLCAATTSGFSQKFFAHLNYTCLDREDWLPFVGIGAELEFGRPTQSISCNGGISSQDCPNAALSMWAIWLKFGLSYN